MHTTQILLVHAGRRHARVPVPNSCSHGIMGIQPVMIVPQCIIVHCALGTVASILLGMQEVEHREGPAAEQLGDASENPAIPGRVAYRARPKAAGDQEPEHMQTDAMEALEAANTAQAIVRTGLHTAPVIMGDAAEGGELGMQVGHLCCS